MCPARRIEADDDPLVPVVRICLLSRRVNEVRDVAVAVQEPARAFEDVPFRHVQRAEGQALPRRHADRQKPTTEKNVPELRAVADAAVPRWRGRDPVALAET